MTESAVIIDLKETLSAIENKDKPVPVSSLELLVDRLEGLKIEIFSREHAPPHFRVICADESAIFRISDCFKLEGKLNRQYRAIREWHSRNKNKLIDAWNKLRPSDCPVGEYQE